MTVFLTFIDRIVLRSIELVININSRVNELRIFQYFRLKTENDVIRIDLQR